MSAPLLNTEARPESKGVLPEVLSENLLENCAVEAWSQLGPERVEPRTVEVLKLRKQFAVYRLTGVGRNGSAVIAKKCSAATIEIERAIYEELLPRLPVSTLRCYGVVKEKEGECGWLFLEEAGRLQYSPLSDDHRALAGRWLGTVHCGAMHSGLATRLPRRDPDHYLRLLRSVRTKVRGLLASHRLPAEDLSLLRSIVSQCDLLESHWEQLEGMCCGLPETVVHGDFVVKNVRLRTARAGPAFLVFNWTIAGWGVPATDLAQFTGRTVSPDFAVYRTAMERCGRALDMEVVRRLAECGKFFRLLDAMAWACVWEIHDPNSSLKKPIALLRCYATRLAEALREAGWAESGRGAAVIRLFDEARIRQKLRKIVARSSKDLALRDDLMQECLVRLWKLELEEPGRTRSWYLQNCRFHVQHFLASGRSLDSPKRAYGDKRVTIDESDGAQPLDWYCTNGELLGEVCAKDILATLARHLKPCELAILSGLDEGLRLEEIAVKLKLSYPTALKYRRKIAALSIKLGISPPRRTTEYF